MDGVEETTQTAPAPLENRALCDEASLCVLASSSKGNCTVLLLGRGESRRLILIDAGLSPRRTNESLESLGLAGVPIHAVLLTHLDHDHWHPGWLGALPERAAVHIHKRHRNRAHRGGILYITTHVFEDDFDLVPGVRVLPSLMSHDTLGAAAFRFEFEHSGRSLGFATDIGRANQKLLDHLAGVDVLAIESNYCPKMQVASGRPDYLQRRIMNGSGHLSNEQAADAVKAIQPREHVILLHLSQECNTPERASMHHWESSYVVTVAGSEAPTPWVRLTWPEAATATMPEVMIKSPQPSPTLWDAAGS